MTYKIELEELLKQGYVKIKKDGSNIVLEKGKEKILYNIQDKIIIENSLDRKVFFSPY